MNVRYFELIPICDMNLFFIIFLRRQCKSHFFPHISKICAANVIFHQLARFASGLIKVLTNVEYMIFFL